MGLAPRWSSVLTEAQGLAVGMVAAVFVGAMLQRVSGTGLGLVVAPTLTVLLGAALGVTVSNVAAALTALLVWSAMRDHVDWGRFISMAPVIILGSVAGAWVIRLVSAAWLDVLVGGTVLLVLLWTLLAADRVPVPRARARLTIVAVGAAAGFMNTTSGVVAPALTAYAVAAQWTQQSFAATLQPVFLLANVSSLVSKTTVGAVPALGELPWWTWLLVALTVPAGVLAGALAARQVSGRTARHTAIGIALVGSGVALVRGLLAL